MSDLIDKQQTIDAVAEALRGLPVVCTDIAKEAVEQLPPVQPERIRGRWIYHPEWENDGECGYECSVCHMGTDVDYNFCMRCGADMRKVTNENSSR